MNIKKRLILLGKSGSGKSYLMRKIIDKGFRPGLKCTTRPIRKFEKQGVDYNFISENIFLELKDNNNLLTSQEFIVTPEGKEPETWYYGITNDEFDSSQAFIMTIGEFYKLTTKQRSQCFVIYLDIDRITRESRLFKRNDKNDSIIRRMDADEIDFLDFDDYDLKIVEPDFNVEEIFSKMII